MRWNQESLWKQIPVPLSLCVSEVYAHEATAGRICWGQSLVLDSHQLLRVRGNPCNPELGMKFFQFRAASCIRHLSRSSLCLHGKCPRDALLLVLKDFNLVFREVRCSLVVRCCEAHWNLLGEAHLNQNQPALQPLQMYCSCKYRRCIQHLKDPIVHFKTMIQWSLSSIHIFLISWVHGLKVRDSSKHGIAFQYENLELSI
jgi:hypothetical protein